MKISKEELKKIIQEELQEKPLQEENADDIRLAAGFVHLLKTHVPPNQREKAYELIQSLAPDFEGASDEFPIALKMRAVKEGFGFLKDQ